MFRKERGFFSRYVDGNMAEATFRLSPEVFKEKDIRARAENRWSTTLGVSITPPGGDYLLSPTSNQPVTNRLSPRRKSRISLNRFEIW